LEDLLGGSIAFGNFILRSMYYLAVDLDTRKTLQKEIDEKIGDCRLPKILDCKNMPYTEAFMLEVFRKTSSPYIPHAATEDTSIEGFEVKKGTVVLLNNYKIFKSPDYWDQPELFQPTRFLENGKIKKPAYFMPFSTGKRSCLASYIFQNISFVIVVSLMQQFDVSLPTDRSFDIKIGAIAMKTQDVIFTKRQ
ncbi:unnamed protein product, partial [Meganyctiphanes norvegica]